MESRDLLIIESMNDSIPFRYLAFVPSLNAFPFDIVLTSDEKLCRVLFRFFDPDDALISAFSDVYEQVEVKAVFNKGWKKDE